MAKEDLDKLSRVEQQKQSTAQNRSLENLDKVTSSKNPFTQIDLDSRLWMLGGAADGSGEGRGFVSTVLQGVLWGQRHVWDRSYAPKYDFSLAQRSQIINYCYDRFTARAARVSRRVSSFEYVPHEERMKSASLKVRAGHQELKSYLEEIDAIREHNQFILTNELWQCHSRAKYGSMLWGMLLGACGCVLFLRKRSAPEKALFFVSAAYASMYYSRVAFTERVIDVYYPFFKFDVAKASSADEKQAVEALMPLGKSRPVHRKMTGVEKELAAKRLQELKGNTDLLAPRFDDIDEKQPPARPWRD